MFHKNKRPVSVFLPSYYTTVPLPKPQEKMTPHRQTNVLQFLCALLSCSSYHDYFPVRCSDLHIVLIRGDRHDIFSQSCLVYPLHQGLKTSSCRYSTIWTNIIISKTIPTDTGQKLCLEIIRIV